MIEIMRLTITLHDVREFRVIDIMNLWGVQGMSTKTKRRIRNTTHWLTGVRRDATPFQPGYISSPE